MEDELKIIKKKYGEKMMQYCRKNFATILDQYGVLSSFLLDTFECNHFLYNDLLFSNNLDCFKNYVINNISQKNNDILFDNCGKTPKELFDSIDYDFIECKTNDDILSFKKYYDKEDELCSFLGNRLLERYVFFVVNRDVNNINKDDFSIHNREDKYGTSVMSIQFSKDYSHTLSIICRYNKSVFNPDATYGNKLDNIIPGLEKSFEKYYGLKDSHLEQNLIIPNYIFHDGKYYYYNYCLNGNIYSDNNVCIVNGKEIKYSKERYILVDYFLIDLKSKKIDLIDRSIDDSFIYYLNDIVSINVNKIGNNKIVTIIQSDNSVINIEISDRNRMVSLTSNSKREIPNNFLSNNYYLKMIDISNSNRIGDDFMEYNNSLEEIKSDNVLLYGDYFLFHNNSLRNINISNAVEIGNYFLCINNNINNINAFNLIKCGNSFLEQNENIDYIYMPKLLEVGSSFCSHCKTVKIILLSDLKEIGDDFLSSCNNFKYIDIHNIVSVENNFIYDENFDLDLLIDDMKNAKEYIKR